MYKAIGSERILINGIILRPNEAFSIYREGQLFKALDESKVFMEIGANLVVEDLIFGRSRFIRKPAGSILAYCGHSNSLGENYLAFVTEQDGPLHSLCIYSESSKELREIELAGLGDLRPRMLAMFCYFDVAVLASNGFEQVVLWLPEADPQRAILVKLDFADPVITMVPQADSTAILLVATSNAFFTLVYELKDVSVNTRLIRPGMDRAGYLSKLGLLVFQTGDRVITIRDQEETELV